MAFRERLLVGELSFSDKASWLPVTLQQAREQCRIAGSYDDATLTRLIQVANEYLGTHFGIYCVRANFLWRTNWPDSSVIALPVWPVSGVSSVKYIDEAGAEQTLAETEYEVLTYGVPAAIVSRRAPNWMDVHQPGRTRLIFWPTTSPSSVLPVTIRGVSGWDSVGDIPAAIQHAILLLVSEWYERRTATDVLSQETAYGVSMLLAPYAWRMTA
ncbi:MAG: phage head-tail connector protein [Gemmatales bacterium]|nr:phage head-tail connector protein [Gemmatales bacterium]MDW8175130.1 phage head-tail connector protein [Gemmatales bacterium]